MLILDASVYIASTLPDEDNAVFLPIVRSIAAGKIQASAPFLFLHEVANSFLNSVRRKRITPEMANHYMHLATTFPIQLDSENNAREALEAGMLYGLTAYDACYLLLAQRLQAPIVTLDKTLEKAAALKGLIYHPN